MTKNSEPPINQTGIAKTMAAVGLPGEAAIKPETKKELILTDIDAKKIYTKAHKVLEEKIAKGEI